MAERVAAIASKDTVFLDVGGPAMLRAVSRHRRKHWCVGLRAQPRRPAMGQLVAWGAHQELACSEAGIRRHQWALLLGEVGLVASGLLFGEEGTAAICFSNDVGTPVMDEDVGTPLLEGSSVTSLSATVVALDAASSPHRQIGDGAAARSY